MRNLEIPPRIRELAELLKPYAPLYIVGGYVRDSLLGIECHDVDICSKLRVETLRNALLTSDFEISDKNLRMGTVVISKGGFKAEYTSFRSDSYACGSGAHSPEEVKFTDDIVLDAQRRDFCCNTVYLDAASGDIVDPLGGENDIRDKLLRRAKEDVLEADGLRILRLVRFAAELGFKPTEDTLASAKQNAWRVRDISAERIRDELDGCFTADIKHPELCRKGAHVEALRMLDELGLVDELFPELAALKGLPQPPKYHLYDAFEHSVKAFELSDPSLRWAALLHDVGKAPCVAKNGNMHGHEVVGEAMVKDILERLRFKRSEVRRISQLVRWHMADINRNMSETKLKRFAVEHSDIGEQLCDLMDIDGLASKGELTRRNRLRDAYAFLKANGLPLSVRELPVSGEDLISLGVPENVRSAALDSLLADTAMDPHLNDRDKALRYLGKWADRA